MERQKIQFTLISGNEIKDVITFHGEYRNLMALINEKIFVEDFGECKGIGRCGTCLVNFSGKKSTPEMDRNEKATLVKAGVDGDHWRLSCQIMIDELLEGSVVTIAEERTDIR